jgi:hypothetical protein
MRIVSCARTVEPKATSVRTARPSVHASALRIYSSWSQNGYDLKVAWIGRRRNVPITTARVDVGRKIIRVGGLTFVFCLM